MLSEPLVEVAFRIAPESMPLRAGRPIVLEPEPAPTRTVRISLDAGEGRRVYVHRVRAFGVPHEETCVADVVVRGLERFATEGSGSFRIDQDGTRARLPVEVLGPGALRIEGARWRGTTSLRINRDPAGVRSQRPTPSQEVPVRNAGFEEWDGSGPSGWAVRDGHARFLQPDRTLATEGSAALCTAGRYYYLFLSQSIAAPEPLTGRLIEYSARVRAFEPGSAYIYLRTPDYGDLYSAHHPGDGRVHTLRVSCRVLPSSATDRITVQLGHGGRPKLPAFFDDVRLGIR